MSARDSMTEDELRHDPGLVWLYALSRKIYDSVSSAPELEPGVPFSPESWASFKELVAAALNDLERLDAYSKTATAGDSVRVQALVDLWAQYPAEQIAFAVEVMQKKAAA
jgi:hypothetical protein